MKRSAVSLMLLLLQTSLAAAAVPAFVTYSGRLTDGTGWGQSETMALTLALYDAESEGAKLWEQSFPDVVIQDGYFSVVLGEGIDPGTGQPLGVTEVFVANDQTWVVVAAGQGLEMEPRQPVGSVPYAASAARSTRVENPHCASDPCENGEIKKVTSIVTVNPQGVEGAWARCPVDHPIPLAGGCSTDNENLNIYANYPWGWQNPESWESSDPSLRASWACAAKAGTISTLTATIICRKK